MYANYNSSDKDGRKKNVREGLPAYAYSRGIELRSDTNPYPYMHSEMYDPRRNFLDISYPVNVPEFELPNEEQINYYEQLMVMSNETIVLNKLLEDPATTQIRPIGFHKKPDSNHGFSNSIHGLPNKNISFKKNTEKFVPFYKICFEIVKVPTNDSKWKLCLITEHSSELRSEIKQIYLYMWLYYKNFMEKVNLGVLDTCNGIIGSGQSVTETERFFLMIRDDYLLATQIFILIKNMLSDQDKSTLKQMMEILELWKILLQNMSTNPKIYELTPNNTSLEMAKLLELLTGNYLKTRNYLEIGSVLMIDKEDTIKEQQVKDDKLCRYWYLMVDTP